MNKKLLTRLALTTICSISLAGCSTEEIPSTPSSSGNTPASKLETAMKDNQTPLQWLEKNASKLTTTEPRASLEDLQPLKEMIGSASIVGLGEASHGMHEIFTMKHRIVQYMVTELGFTNLVLEENWGKGLMLDQYVLTGKGHPDKILSPVFNNKEMTQMLEWIRDYNANPKHPNKVRVIGMDQKKLDEHVFNKISDYIQQYHPDLISQLNDKMKELISATKDEESFEKLPKDEKEKHLSNARSIIELLEKNKANAGKQKEAYAWALHSARIIEQFIHMLSAEQQPEFFLRHDIAMYENAKWTQEQWGKTIVWGHNGHISKTNTLPFVYPEMSGQHLAKHYGDKYVSIGTSIHSGSYNVVNESGKFGPYGTVRIDDPNSINYTVGQVKHDQFFVDLRKASGSVKTWLDETRPLFAGITKLGPEVPLFVDAAFGKTFDIFFYIKKVTPSQMNE
ncbi:erythromycin esterase [Brevibacillus sp. IT-7CA2]|uniref:Erythromycin esterase n=1 Tax=Brevibacillus formosus TaxID=54913 RepID=A0A220MMN9_9BACL|nr:erythromycin esterase family protein [Brevibacillus formosus]ASJ56404.1 erythromycin esterase [Brevibacillus formosus]